MPSITVAICSKDRPQKLKHLLYLLSLQTLLPQEIVIIEDTSNFPPIGLSTVKKYFDKTQVTIRYVQVSYANIANSRNAALKKCTKDILIFMDDDVEPPPTLLWTYHQLYNNYPQALGFVGNVSPIIENSWSRFAALYYNSSHFRFKKITRIVLPASFSTISFQRSFFVMHKLFFDVSIQTGEDIDMLITIANKGGKIYFSPKIETKHFLPSNIVSFFKSYFHYAIDFSYLQNKYPRMIDIKEYFPQRLLHACTVPLFFLYQPFIMTTSTLKKFQLKRSYFFVVLIHQIAVFFGIYSSSQGRLLFKKYFKQQIEKLV